MDHSHQLQNSTIHLLLHLEEHYLQKQEGCPLQLGDALALCVFCLCLLRLAYLFVFVFVSLFIYEHVL
jgi:hypothetical protein